MRNYIIALLILVSLGTNAQSLNVTGRCVIGDEDPNITIGEVNQLIQCTEVHDSINGYDWVYTRNDINSVFIWKRTDLINQDSSIFTKEYTQTKLLEQNLGSELQVWNSTATDNTVVWDGETGDFWLGARSYATGVLKNTLYWDLSKGSFSTGRHTGSLGQLQNMGNYAAQFGDRTFASGNNSFAAGGSNQANGSNSTVFGNSNTVNGSFSFGGGAGVINDGVYSLAYGQSVNVNSAWGLAIGLRITGGGSSTIRLGKDINGDCEDCILLGTNLVTNGNLQEIYNLGKDNSFEKNKTYALGSGNIMKASQSTSIGLGNITASRGETVVGAYSAIFPANDSYSAAPNNYSFRVGNGSLSSTRSDAFVVRKDGFTSIIGKKNISDSLLIQEIEPRALLDVKAVTNAGSVNSGVILADMTMSQRNDIIGVNLINGLEIYCIDCVTEDGSVGVKQVYQESTGSWRNCYGEGGASRNITTGTLVDFETKKVFGSDGNPVEGDITFNLTGAVTDEQYMIHSDSSLPSFPVVAFVSGTYLINQNNFIIIKYITPTRVMVWINE